jgi:hypothetical protein
MEDLKQHILSEVVEYAYDAEDVYEALKRLMDEDYTTGGLFKIEMLDEDDSVKVSYIPSHIARQLDKNEQWRLTYADDWVRYHNDYTICYELLKHYSRL